MDKLARRIDPTWRISVSVLALCLVFASFSAKANNVFQSGQFLDWKTQNQDAYIETSVGMASLIAAQSDKAQAKCIDDWYYVDEARANDAVRDVIRANPQFHPRGVILAVVQKQCGTVGAN